MTDQTADALVANARRAVHESLALLPAWEADRVHSLIGDLETAVEGRTAMRFTAAPAEQAPATDRAGLMRAHVALAEQAGRDQAAIARVLEFAASLDEIGRNLAGPDAVHPVAEHIRHLLDTTPAVEAQQPTQRNIQCPDAFWRPRPHAPHDWQQGPDTQPVHCRGVADTQQPKEAQQPEDTYCKCRSCWGWFVEEHPGEDLDELGRDLRWWSGLPKHRDAPASAVEAQSPREASGERVVAYRSALPGAMSIYCTRHTDELGDGVMPLTSDDLPNGGLCAGCGADVLIEQQPKEA